MDKEVLYLYKEEGLEMPSQFIFGAEWDIGYGNRASIEDLRRELNSNKPRKGILIVEEGTYIWDSDLNDYIEYKASNKIK